MKYGYQPAQGYQPDAEPGLWVVVGQKGIYKPDNDQFLWTENSRFAEHQALVVGQVGKQLVGIVRAQLAQTVRQQSIHSVLALQDRVMTPLLSHGLQLLTCAEEQQFCGKCGGQCQLQEGEWAMVCGNCNTPHYPRISPCIIVLVHKGDEILLVQHHRHLRDNPVFTVVAGFIEPGESAEEAVVREVLEETGLTVRNPRYCFSQSWPFPHSLMLGFHAEYVSGELQLEEGELCDGGWFMAGNLPIIPPAFTISRQLIDLYFI